MINEVVLLKKGKSMKLLNVLYIMLLAVSFFAATPVKASSIDSKIIIKCDGGHGDDDHDGEE